MVHLKFSLLILLAVTVLPGFTVEPSGEQDEFESLEVLSALESRIGVTAATARIYQVSSDPHHYATISQALAAATDPATEKVILVHSGTHTEAVTIRTPRTHLVGADRQGARITASLMAVWASEPSAIVDVQASNCSISNITIRNTAVDPGPRCAVRVGNSGPLEAITGFQCFNADLIAAQDTIWLQDNVVDGLVEDCFIEGTSDVVCNSGMNNTFRRCHVKGDGTWAAFWCGQKAECGTASQTNIIDCTFEKALFGILIARSHVFISGCTGIPNVDKQGQKKPMPLYSTSSDNTIAYLLHGQNQGFGFRWQHDVGDLCAYEVDDRLAYIDASQR